MGGVEEIGDVSFNHLLCGYDSVFVYGAAMQMGRDLQFEAFVVFIKNMGFDVLLMEWCWEEFAQWYNVEGYKENQYDERLEAAFLQYSNELPLYN